MCSHKQFPSVNHWSCVSLACCYNILFLWREHSLSVIASNTTTPVGAFCSTTRRSKATLISPFFFCRAPMKPWTREMLSRLKDNNLSSFTFTNYFKIIFYVVFLYKYKPSHLTLKLDPLLLRIILPWSHLSKTTNKRFKMEHYSQLFFDYVRLHWWFHQSDSRMSLRNHSNDLYLYTVTIFIIKLVGLGLYWNIQKRNNWTSY